MRLPKPDDYGLNGDFASEADRKAAVDRYEADWYAARAVGRDELLTDDEREAYLQALGECIRERYP